MPCVYSFISLPFAPRLGEIPCETLPEFLQPIFFPPREQGEGDVTGNGHAGVALPTSQMLLFAQPRGPTWCPHTPPVPLFLFPPSQQVQGTLDPLSSILAIPMLLLPSQCLSQGEEIRMFFLPFVSAHSYLCQDQPVPRWHPQLSPLPW